MKFIEKIVNILSQEKYRYLFLFLFLIFIIIILIPVFNADIGYQITDIPDYFQLVILGITLIIIYIQTDKKELNRYKENYLFYKKRYSKHELIYIQKDEQKLYSSSIEYNLSSVSNKIKNIYLKDIVFKQSGNKYELPYLIEEQARNILIEKFNIQAKTDYNGLTLSLKKLFFENNKLIFIFDNSFYYNYLLTNMIPEYEIMHNLTIRDLLEPSNTHTLSFLEDSLAENHLGISSLINIKTINKEFLLIPVRSNKTTVFKGQLSPSVSGAANIHTCKQNNLSIENFFTTELEEEIGVFFKNYVVEEIDYVNYFIENARLLGISRELKRLGKPEIFFYCEMNLELKNIYETNNSIIKLTISDQSDINEMIDSHENETLLLIEKNKIFDYLSYYEKASKSTSSFEGKEIYIRLNDEYLVSESLFVNLAYLSKFLYAQTVSE